MPVPTSCVMMLSLYCIHTLSFLLHILYYLRCFGALYILLISVPHPQPFLEVALFDELQALTKKRLSTAVIKKTKKLFRLMLFKSTFVKLTNISNWRNDIKY